MKRCVEIIRTWSKYAGLAKRWACLFGAFLPLLVSCDQIRRSRDISEVAATPQDALWAFRCENAGALSRLMSRDLSLGSLFMTGDSTRVCAMERFNAWLRKLPVLAEIARNPFWVSAHSIGKNQALLISLPQLTHEQLLWQQLRENGFTFLNTQTPDGELIQVKSPTGDQLFAIRQAKRLLVSESRILLESAVHQIKAGFSLASSHDFAYAHEQAGMNRDVCLFVNTEGIAGTAQTVYLPSAVAWVQKIKNLGKWIVLDINKQDQSFGFEGLLTNSPIEMSVSKVWLKKEERRLEVWSSLPANVKQAWVESMEGVDEGVKQMQQYRDKNVKSSELLPQMTQQLIAPKDVSALVKEWDPVQLMLADVVMGDGADVWMNVMRCGRIDEYRRAVVTALGNYDQMTKLGEVHLVRSYPVDSTGASIKIYMNPFKSLYPYLFGKMYALVTDAYIAFDGDYAIIGPTPLAIIEWVGAKRTGKVLSEMGYMQRMINEAETKGLMFYFLRPDIQKTPWINSLQSGVRKKLHPADFDLAWAGAWMRIRPGKDNVRLEGVIMGRSSADTLKFSNPAGLPLMK